MTQLLKYYIRMGQTSKSNCAPAPIADLIHPRWGFSTTVSSYGWYKTLKQINDKMSEIERDLCMFGSTGGVPQLISNSFAYSYTHVCHFTTPDRTLIQSI